MINYSQLTKLKKITAVIVFVKYSLWYFYFILQGKAINLAIEKNTLHNQLMYTLIGYVLVKVFVMLCDIFQKFIVEYYKNIELKRQWSHYIPKKIYSDNQNNKNNINVLFFDYFPRLFDFEISILTNNITMYYIFAMTISAFLYTGFSLGILALSFVFVLNFLSKNIFIKKIDEYQKEANYSKIKILNWVEQYFSSYREISKNWHGITNATWKDDVYNKYFTSKSKQVVFYLYRDLLAQVLVELPFLLNTSIVILGVYYDYLSLTQLFVWVGFSQFMINASNAYLENRINKKQLVTLTAQASLILQGLSSKVTVDIIDNKDCEFLFSEIVMRDGETNRLSLEPGLYHIKGGNGSGKSTLMNIFLGYERKDYNFKNTKLSRLLAEITQENVRVIERESVVFDCLDDMNSQICGPLGAINYRWEIIIIQSLSKLLAPDLVRKWMEVFIGLESEYTSRKDKIMSSGEKVILSLMRFFSSWNVTVNLLIIDECDSFLDYDKKKLFIETVQALADHMAVYISCHDASLTKFLEKPIVL